QNIFASLKRQGTEVPASVLRDQQQVRPNRVVFHQDFRTINEDGYTTRVANDTRETIYDPATLESTVRKSKTYGREAGHELHIEATETATFVPDPNDDRFEGHLSDVLQEKIWYDNPKGIVALNQTLDLSLGLPERITDDKGHLIKVFYVLG